MFHLIFSRDSLPCFQVRLGGSHTKIGRSGLCDVVLPDPEISREHVCLYHVEGRFFLKTLTSQKVRINGKEIECGPLKAGDEIHLARWTVSFQEKSTLLGPEDPTQVTGTVEGQTQAVAQNSLGIWTRNFTLIAQQPGKPEQRLLLQEKAMTIGTAPGNNLVLEDPYISARHLKLTTGEEEGVWIYDLGSTNGTFLGEVKVREARWDPDLPLRIGQCRLHLVEEGGVEELQPLETDHFCGMVGTSPAMQKLYGSLQRIAPSETTVLILGESGVGKELVARGLHQLSRRRSGPFVALNCGAIPRDLIESELFGHEKGAFTGAMRRHDGAFAQAKGGTLFLDEIGELPLDLQPKLLRVLESRTYRRLGGSEELSSDVRVVAATHQDLAERVKAKQFRGDLFFRLFVFPLAVPPLRERLEDLPLLAKAFLKEFSTGSAVPRLSEAALKKLTGHDFPGNVRELRNILLRGLLFAEGREIPAKSVAFPDDFSSPQRRDDTFAGVQKLETVERKMIERALLVHQWNKAKAAESLGVAKSTLFTKIKLYDLKDPEEK
jgi:DNA-binding NtrC family response regulator/pSer/pThr/pTyr-binding forkhead associated (FHA) protein